MTLLADNLFGLSDAVWLAILGVITMALKEWIDQWKARRLAEKVGMVAEKAEVAVSQAQDTATAVKDVAAKVEEVHKATNSLTDRLVEATEKEALARGGVEERARAEERARRDNGGPEGKGVGP